MVGYRKARQKRFSGLLMISAEQQTKISAKLEKHCGAIVNIDDYEDEDIRKILEQRIALYGLMIEEQEKIVDAIVHIVNCDVRLSIDLLHWSYRCCRAMGEDMITIKHLNKALHLKR